MNNLRQGTEKVTHEIAEIIKPAYKANGERYADVAINGSCLLLADSIILKLQQAGWKPPEPMKFDERLRPDDLYDIIEDAISWGVLHPDFNKYHELMEVKIRQVTDEIIKNQPSDTVKETPDKTP